MKHKVIWEPNTAKYAHDFIGRIGKIRVGSVVRALVAKQEATAYDAHLALPGIQMKGTTRFSTPEAAMARVDNAVASWFAFLEADNG